MTVETRRFVKNKHEGYKIEIAWTFSPKFGDLIGHLAPNPTPIISQVVPPTLPNENEVIHVYCDIVIPSMVGRQCVHMLDIIPSREVLIKLSIMNMYKQVAPRSIDSITIRMTNQLGEDVPFSPHVNVFAVLHFRQRE